MVTDQNGHSNAIKSVQKVFCRTCVKYFVGDTVFDAHRVGNTTRGMRRCLATNEMQFRGFASEKRMVRLILDGAYYLEEHDVWFLVADRERAKRAVWRRPSESENTDEDDEALV